jgi:hypothetical protein
MKMQNESLTDTKKEAMNTLCSPSIEPYISAETSYRNKLEWLVKLANTKGWKEYTWHRAKELNEIQLFTGIKDDLVKIMRLQNDTTKE